MMRTAQLGAVLRSVLGVALPAPVGLELRPHAPDSALPMAAFQDAIRSRHGCPASFVSRTRVAGAVRMPAAHERDVLIFALHGHPRATHCYAWEESGRIRSSLHDDRVRSPAAALRAGGHR